MCKCAALFILSTLAVAGTRPRSIPLLFEANLGQTEPTATFLGRGPGYAIHFDGNAISLVRGQDVVRMDLQGALPPHISGYQAQEGRANYFIGNPDRWISDVPLYAGVQYRGVYPGVDLVFYSSEGELEYDFTLAPGASASTIKLAFRGIEAMRIDGGDLVLKTGWGELRHRKPRIYQMRKGKRSEIGGRFVIRGPKVAGFETDLYDARNSLVIDPVMAYSTYIGGAGADSAWAVAVDSAGSAYVVGETWPVNFPKTFTISTSGGNGDAFIIKLNPSGTGALYATYFGGNGRDSARGVAVDSAGNAYVTGFTYSPDFPATAGAYRSPSLGQGDAFAIKVNASGSALVYAALLGGPGSDFATGIAIDGAGNAYISGYTSSVAFPVTPGVSQPSFGGGLQDAFVAKLNPTGSGLIYSTYLGGSGNDVANGLAVDSLGSAYVVGYTDSLNFPVRNPFQANAGGQGDAFIGKLSPAGDVLAFSTYLGGRQADVGTAVALDPAGNVYITGSTLSTDFPVTTGAFQTVNHGSYDAFVSVLNPQGSGLIYSTYVGGEGADQAASIAVDASGVAYIAGFTYSFQFPVRNPVQLAAQGRQEAFAAAVATGGASLSWSTYLGGAGDDQATGIAVDRSGGVYVVGSTLSSNFPTTPGAYRPAYAGGDGFLVKLTVSTPTATALVHIETPSTGSVITGTTTVTGWAVNNGGAVGTGIGSIQVKVDGNAVGAANWGLFRPDVCNSYPGQAGCPNVGFSFVLSIQSLSPGAHTITVSATDTNGFPDVGSATVPFTIFAGSVTVVTADSVSPPAGNTASATFTAVYSDTAGFANLGHEYLLINTSVNGSNACYVVYQGSNNTLMLLNDAGNGWLGPIVAGSGTTLQNSQCTLNGLGSSGLGSGNSLTLTVSLSFKAAFAGSRTVFLNADGGGLSSGWQNRGTWMVPNSAAVTADSVSPPAGNTASATLTAVYSDTAGYGNLGVAHLLINSAVDGSRACYVVYQGSNNTLMLLNDAANAWLGPIVAGSGTTLQNSQCSLNGIGSSGVGSGNRLTLTVSLSFKAAFGGSRTVFLNADGGGLSAGWQSRGTWTVPNGAAVTADSVTPSSGNTSSATLTAVYSDTAGFANLGHEYLLINTAVDGSNACYVVYQGSNNTLTLLNDAGNGWLGPIVAGTGTTLQNSQCTLNGLGSSGVGSGNSLTLTLSLIFKAAFAGSRTVFLNADGGGLSSGWQSRATWTVP